MYKLIILIGPVADKTHFSEGWPRFLHLAEDMPGLIREAAVRIQQPPLYGDLDTHMIHELFFEDQEALLEALTSPKGKVAGEQLQSITAGQMTLLIAEHKEDDIENLRNYKIGKRHADSQ
jgi:uncharacterized protein (TIGR02118 family)